MASTAIAPRSAAKTITIVGAAKCHRPAAAASSGTWRAAPLRPPSHVLGNCRRTTDACHEEPMKIAPSLLTLGPQISAATMSSGRPRGTDRGHARDQDERVPCWL